jgi:microcompartment protein CcmK/EutM
MLLGRVIGTVWATEKDPSLEGMKLLIVREVDLKYKAKDKFLIAVDTVQAGVGEIVLIAGGSSARQTATTKNKPVDAVVMAIVDNLAVKDAEELEREYQERRAPIKLALESQAEV